MVEPDVDDEERQRRARVQQLLDRITELGARPRPEPRRPRRTERPQPTTLEQEHDHETDQP